ncbi:putative lipoprotein [Pirellulimonas nuda]|uniref:Putative lipoprotein n=2 Tax=Pirellulimonas nuda TaxID=2528009 RepID=A0A518DC29_9BACT|nr:putative lipoprotein [Pirellulimonas nuda]
MGTQRMREAWSRYAHQAPCLGCRLLERPQSLSRCLLLIAAHLVLGQSTIAEQASMIFVGEFSSAVPGTTTGSGSAGVAENWRGRVDIEVIDPETGEAIFTYHLPEPGDDLYFGLNPLFFGVPGMRSVAMSTFENMNEVGFLSHSTFNGGFVSSTSQMYLSNQEDIIGIEGFQHDYLPMVFEGTGLDAPIIEVTATDRIDFNNVTELFADEVSLTGTASLLDPLPETPVMNFREGSAIYAGQLRINAFVPTDILFDNGRIETLGVQVASANSVLGAGLANVVWGNDSLVNIDQFLLVGVDVAPTAQAGVARVTIEENTLVAANNAYVNVGERNRGEVFVRQGAELRAREVAVGVHDEGLVSIDSMGKVLSGDAYLARVAGSTGTINVEQGGEWETGNLVIGEYDTGYAFIRDGGTLKVNSVGVLGFSENARGVLNLIGPTAKLDLGQSGSLQIGGEGRGELNLSQGATITSLGAVMLGANATGSGVVTIEGQDSRWILSDDLVVGQEGEGTLMIAEGGRIETQSPIEIGLHESSNGVIVLDGAESALISSSDLILAGEGVGRLEVVNGAQLTIQAVMIGQGETAEAQGELKVHGAGSSAETTGAFVVGGGSKGLLFVEDGALLANNGDVVVGQSVGIGAEVMVSSTGDPARWEIGGDASFGLNSKAHVRVEQAGHLQVAGALNLGQGQGGDGLLEIVGERANVAADDLRIGNVGTGEVTVKEGGRLVTQGRGVVSSSAPGPMELHGTISIVDPGSRWEIGEDLTVGAETSQKGEFNIAYGGTVTTGGDAVIARDSGSSGEATIDGEVPTPAPTLWTLGGDLTIGGGGQGRLDVVFGGRFVGSSSTDIVIGAMAGSEGVLNVRGNASGQLTAATHGGNMKVGGSGSGALFVSQNSTLTTGGDAVISETSGADGYVRLFSEGAKWEITGDLKIGAGQSATLAVQDKAQLVVMKDFSILEGQGTIDVTVSGGASATMGAFQATVASQINIDGAETLWSAESVAVGGGAKMRVTGGATMRIRPEPHAGLDVNEGGVLTVLGSPGATTTVEMNGGGGFDVMSVSGLAEFGDYTRFDNNLTLVLVDSGGRLNLSGEQSHFLAQNAKITAGGVLSVSGVREFGMVGSLDVFGGQALLDNMSDLGAGVRVAGGFGAPTGTLVVSGQTTTGPTVIGAGSSGVATVSSGATWTVGNENVGGRLELGGASPDGTEQGSGFLQLDSGSTVNVLGDVIIRSGSAWGGSGTIIANNFRNDGKGTPGQSPGIITIDANYTQSVTGSLELEIGGLTPGVQHDQVVFLGDVDLGGDVILRFINGFAPQTDDVFSLLRTNPAALVGWNPSTVQIEGLAPGFEYSIDVTDDGVGVIALNDGVAIGLAGDYNSDGAVDAADYTVWRDGLGVRFGQSDYDVWRIHFGESIQLGQAAPISTPEPAAIVLAALIAVCGASWKGGPSPVANRRCSACNKTISGGLLPWRR